jgi:hypothetical protein
MKPNPLVLLVQLIALAFSSRSLLLVAIFIAIPALGRIAPEEPSDTPLVAPYEPFNRTRNPQPSAGHQATPSMATQKKRGSRKAQPAWAAPPEHAGPGVQFKISRRVAKKSLAAESKGAALARILQTVRRVVSHVTGDVTPKRVFRHAGKRLAWL